MDKRKVDLIYKHGEIEGVETFGSKRELLEMEKKDKQDKSSVIKGTVTINLEDYQTLIEEKRVAQATLQILVDTIHEVQPLIEKNICSKNHRETIYILEQLDEALEYYYG